MEERWRGARSEPPTARSAGAVTARLELLNLEAEPQGQVAAEPGGRQDLFVAVGVDEPAWTSGIAKEATSGRIRPRLAGQGIFKEAVSAWTV